LRLRFPEKSLKVPPKLVCLEGYWNERVFQTFSVKGFFEAMAPLQRPPLTIAHRFVDSEAGLAYYAKRPDGLMWRNKELFDTPIYYLAFHGKPGAVSPLLGRIEAERLCEAFAGYGGYKNLVYFACCNVLRGEEGRVFARRFLKPSTGWRAWSPTCCSCTVSTGTRRRGATCAASSTPCSATTRLPAGSAIL
jgi:hypothetical protein